MLARLPRKRWRSAAKRLQRPRCTHELCRTNKGARLAAVSMKRHRRYPDFDVKMGISAEAHRCGLTSTGSDESDRAWLSPKPFYAMAWLH